MRIRTPVRRGPEASRHTQPALPLAVARPAPRHPRFQQTAEEKADSTGWEGEEGGERKAGGGSDSSTKDTTAENPSFVTLGARRPAGFYAHDGNNQEPWYKKEILDASGTT